VSVRCIAAPPCLLASLRRDGGPCAVSCEASCVALIASVTLACSVTIFARYGTYAPTARLHGPGLLLDGGGPLEALNSSLEWLHRRLVGNTSQPGGNVVVLAASDARNYDRSFYRYAHLASVQTVLIPPCASRAQVDSVARLVDRADAVYFAGGDQAHYVAWKGTALMRAVTRVYARDGVVGGGSAGLAIQGAVVYDSVAGDRLNQETHTNDAVENPLEPRMSFTTGLFAWPALADTITDTHLVVRNRFGRMIVFLARILHDHLLPGARAVYGLGIDQASSVVVDPDGTATVLNGAEGRGAYLVRADGMPQLVPGLPLRYTVAVSHIGGSGERFDLLHKRTTEPWYTVTIDGARTPAYSRDPYAR
jgi:cyanophycinase-like exopeptidase